MEQTYEFGVFDDDDDDDDDDGGGGGGGGDHHTCMFLDLSSGRLWSANLPSPAGNVPRILLVWLHDELYDQLCGDGWGVGWYHASISSP